MQGNALSYRAGEAKYRLRVLPDPRLISELLRKSRDFLLILGFPVTVERHSRWCDKHLPFLLA